MNLFEINHLKSSGVEQDTGRLAFLFNNFYSSKFLLSLLPLCLLPSPYSVSWSIPYLVNILTTGKNFVLDKCVQLGDPATRNFTYHLQELSSLH